MSTPPIVTTVKARTGGSVALKAGDHVSVVNVHGGQVVDSWAFPTSGEDPYEYMSMEHSRIHHYRLMFRPGDALVTNRLREILTFVADTSPGVHDTQCPACCDRSYRLYYETTDYHANCSDNLRAVMKANGRELAHVPTPWNLFMHTVVEDNAVFKDYPSKAEPGAAVTLRAEIDCLFAVSACPQDIIAINGDDAVPRDIELHHFPAA
ncbi:DUF1989 domain-containing protein [Jiella mangrovi]|uniref:Urea carboxylase-associated family protein n=1 Tax=Jiella mangrovi TaxID=2821407 RepID=A0ABS4BGL2_9HYPH|nr:urea carboxylase-associated family protein [Jiella mangrovi]MBP0615902.1 urea carboxylase-associated family protein [Jiella mangrovi]